MTRSIKVAGSLVLIILTASVVLQSLTIVRGQTAVNRSRSANGAAQANPEQVDPVRIPLTSDAPEIKRIREHRKLVQQGAAPIYQIGGILPPNNPQYVQLSPIAPNHTPLPPQDMAANPIGSKIYVNSEFPRNTVVAQKRFADIFLRLDPQPLSRSAHFSWLPHFDHVTQLGWTGKVIHMENRDDGIAFTIKISPYLSSSQIRTVVLDSVEEVYLLNDNGLNFISTNADIPKPWLQHFPFH